MPGDTTRKRHKAAHMRHDASKARTRTRRRAAVAGAATLALAFATATACAPANTEPPAKPEPAVSPESPDDGTAKLVVNGHGLEVGSSRIRDAREAFGEYMPTLDDVQADADEGYEIARDVEPGLGWKISFKWRGAKATVSGRNETGERLPIDDITVDAVRIEWDGPGRQNCGAEIAGLGLGESVLREASKIAESAGGTTQTDGTVASVSWDATAGGKPARVSLRLWAGEKPVGSEPDAGDASGIKPAENREEAFLRDIAVELA